MCATSEDSDVSELLAHEKSPKLFKLLVKQVLYMHAHLPSLKISIKFPLSLHNVQTLCVHEVKAQASVCCKHPREVTNFMNQLKLTRTYYLARPIAKILHR